MVVVPGVIELVGVLFPNQFPFPSHSMPRATTHPAAERIYPNVDHVLARAVGGTGEEDNLVTACTICNEQKGARSGWTLLQRTIDSWDGLKGRYRDLYVLGGAARNAFHKPWLAALAV